MKSKYFFSFAGFFLLAILISSIVNEFESKQRDDHRSCSCSGAFCSCSITCTDKDETPNCTCGAFSCTCSCGVKDMVAVPSQSETQRNRSISLENYLNGIGTTTAIELAKDVKNLRDAIQTQDVSKYKAAAEKTAIDVVNLSPSEKNNINNWFATEGLPDRI